MRRRRKPFYRWNDQWTVKKSTTPPIIDREIAAKVLRDLGRLGPGARRLDIEAAVWRSVARHARALSSEQIADVTWLILNHAARSPKVAA